MPFSQGSNQQPEIKQQSKLLYIFVYAVLKRRADNWKTDFLKQ